MYPMHTTRMKKASFSCPDGIPTLSGVEWNQPLFIFKEQALTLHINNDNFDKVLLMWDGGCAMRAERQHWMSGTVNCGERVQEGPFLCRLILGLPMSPEGLIEPEIFHPGKMLFCCAQRRPKMVHLNAANDIGIEYRD
ncbi:hypothetical protein BDV28DRAFT_137860 [Aspergillus coremiiformis]|uniref:Uncharacterized protein n=1 Tax=Aspergillus coremiiformis TaxID=138285 RepID=A0A5N6Z0Y9_9EURO|nr:hypothetical protein BDV28DRAFT_137860 [Aspergillus coremiiformis]